MKKIFIGTSGYNYYHWRGNFYPKDLPQYKFLEHYCKYFDTVELNVTFYRLLNKKTFEGWYKRTPKDFLFVIKGNRYITYIKKLKDCKNELKNFFENAKGLKEKLKVVLWQLPPSLKCDLKRFKKFIKDLKNYKDYLHCFEFREKSWFCSEIYDILKKNKMSFCLADWPDFGIELPYNFDFIYLRRHGVKKDKLYSKNYSEKELKEEANLIKKLRRKTKYIFVYFNNDAQGFAIKNALRLKELAK